VPSFHGLPPEDGAGHRVSWPCRPVSGQAAGAVSCALLAPAGQPLTLVSAHGGSTTPSLALSRDAGTTGYSDGGFQGPPFIPAAER
jgi:hypothetical protein